MGRERRTTHVQHAGGRIRRRAHADRHPRRMDRRPAREVLPVLRDEYPHGTARPTCCPPNGCSRRTTTTPSCTWPRSPNASSRRPATRREPLLRLGVLPLALHERSLPLARHRRGGSPHGLLGPPGPPPSRRRPTRRGGRQPRDRAQLGGQHRRDRRRRAPTPTETPSTDCTITGAASRRTEAASSSRPSRRRPRGSNTASATPPRTASSRARGSGFDTVYLGPGSEMAFTLANRYEDHRAAPEATHLPGPRLRPPRRGAIPAPVHPRRGGRESYGPNSRPARRGSRPRRRDASPTRCWRCATASDGSPSKGLGSMPDMSGDRGDDRGAAAADGLRELGPSKTQAVRPDLLRGGPRRAWRSRCTRSAPCGPASAPDRDSARRSASPTWRSTASGRRSCSGPSHTCSTCGSTPKRRRKGSGSNRPTTFSAQVPRRTGAAGPTSRSRWSGGMRRRRCTRRDAGATAKGTAR